MKNLKKVLCMGLSFVLCGVMCVPAFAADNKRQYLEENGFPTDFLERRTDYQIDELYKACYEEGYAFDSTKVTTLDEQVENEGSVRAGTISEDDMTLELSTLVGTDLSNEVEDVKVYVYYEWVSGKPWIKGEDAIAVNWNPDVFTFESDSFKSTCFADGVRYENTSRYAESEQGAIGYYVELRNTPGVLDGTGSFTLVPTVTPLYTATKSTTGRIAHELNVEYVHNQSPVSGLSFEAEGFGLSVDTSGSCDKASDTVTSYYKRSN